MPERRGGMSMPYSATRADVFTPAQYGVTSGEPLAMVYCPESTFTDIYDDAEGLDKGTIFADLFFPFEATCGGVR